MTEIEDKPDDGSIVIETLPKKYDLEAGSHLERISKVRKPIKFTTKSCKTILSCLAYGAPPETAAAKANITPQTLFRWWQKGAEVDENEVDEALLEYKDFYLACMRAQSDGELFFITKLKEATEGKQQIVTNKGEIVDIVNPDGHLALKALPILFPNKYGSAIQKHVHISQHSHTHAAKTNGGSGPIKDMDKFLEELDPEEIKELLRFAKLRRGDVIDAEVINAKE